MLKELMRVLPLSRTKFAEDETIKKCLNLGRTPISDVSNQIVYETTLNATELNELNDAQAFMTLSLNSILATDTSYSAILKIGIAANAKLPTINGLPVPLVMLDAVLKIMGSNKFGLPNKPTFETADEVNFDDQHNILGYVALFVIENGKEIENEF